jgi:hypothetical protein
MPWYRRNSATNTSVAGGVNNWRQIANIYRRNGSGNWEQIKRVYRKNSNSPTAYQGPGAWVLVHNSDTLNPYNTITPEFTTDTGGFHDTAKITLTRGTWANTGTAFAPITYDLDIQYSTDNTNWTNMVTGSGTTLTYTITSNDVSPPSYYFRGRVRVKNSSSVYSGYITVNATERSYRDIDVTYLFTTMNGHSYQASWTLSKNNNATNVNTQRVEIRTNDSFTYQGVSYSPGDLVYSVTVPAGTDTQQINFLNANIKDNQSYYTELVIIANDSDQTTSYEIGDDFTYQGIPVIAPFGIVSFTKGGVSGSSQGVTRTTALSWGSATNASRYEVYYQGRDSSSDPWTDLELVIPYIYEPTTSANKTFTSNQTPTFKTFIRARIRASNTQGSTMIFNTGDYVEATGTAPGQPSFGTITKTDVSASIPVTAGSQGSHYRYEVMEYQYRTSPFGSYPGTWSTQVLSSGSGTISLSNLSANQLYYIKIRNRNYDEIYSDENETTFQTNAALTGATSTSISSMSRLNDTTVRAVINSSGASGPYYQLWWVTSSTAPSSENRYDAASTTSTVTEDSGFNAGSTYYFYIRSSSENLGDTTTNGTSTGGTFSAYGPSTGAASYTFVAPSGATSSVSGSSTVGSTLTLTANSPTSAAPAASTTSIIWRVNDGGPGGNSFTAGSVLQNGGTTFVIPQYLYGSVSSVGYSVRAEVTWNNGAGSQIANSTATVVASNVVTPSGGTATVTPSSGTAGSTTYTASTSGWSGSPTSYSYSWQYFSQVSFSYVQYTTGSTFSPPSNINSVYPNYGWLLSVAASNTAGTAYATTTFTVNNPAVVQYTVTWNGNSGTVSPTSSLVTAGSSVTAPTPSRSGHTFDYWYDNSFSYIVYAGNTFTPPSTITMNASWTQVVVQTPSITSGPSISWGSGNNYTLSASASNATNLEFQVQYSSSSSGSPSTGSATYFFGASTGGGTTGSQAANRNWARTRVRANNSNSGLSSAFSSYTGWA